MFESAELGHCVDKKAFEREVPKLRMKLLDAQLEIFEKKKFPVIVLIGGVDGAGKGETANILSEWMDPRHIQTHAFGPQSDEERERPPMWRYWRALPAKGKLGIFFGSWYSQPITARVYGESKTADLDRAMDEAVRFERMLTDEGAVILKFWFHLSKKAQKKRLAALESDEKTRWRVTERDWRHLELYGQFRKVSERALRRTSTAQAPWVVVEGSDARYRSLTTGKVLLDAMTTRLADGETRVHTHAPPTTPSIDRRDVLKELDLTKRLEKKEYKDELAALEARLNALSRHKRFSKIAVMLVFEGNDAAGKGGTIRRITGALDARQYGVIPTAAPTEEERAQPYLWRFWRKVPRRGHIAIFDRSWYGRVLVERVEGFASVPDWMRAYGEINDFEERLAEHGIVLAKFWLAISKDEQLRRFEEREKTGFKRFKITKEDWRNRKKWGDYERAVCDMVDRTSTEIAPWHLVEANDKYYARIKTLKAICERIESAL